MKYLLAYILLICCLTAQAGEYAAHLGGSGTRGKAGKLLLAGDDIFAERLNYSALQEKHSLIGRPVFEFASRICKNNIRILIRPINMP